MVAAQRFTALDPVAELPRTRVFRIFLLLFTLLIAVTHSFLIDPLTSVGVPVKPAGESSKKRSGDGYFYLFSLLVSSGGAGLTCC